MHSFSPNGDSRTQVSSTYYSIINTLASKTVIINLCQVNGRGKNMKNGMWKIFFRARTSSPSSLHLCSLRLKFHWLELSHTATSNRKVRKGYGLAMWQGKRAYRLSEQLAMLCSQLKILLALSTFQWHFASWANVLDHGKQIRFGYTQKCESEHSLCTTQGCLKK